MKFCRENLIIRAMDEEEVIIVVQEKENDDKPSTKVSDGGWGWCVVAGEQQVLLYGVDLSSLQLASSAIWLMMELPTHLELYWSP